MGAARDIMQVVAIADDESLVGGLDCMGTGGGSISDPNRICKKLQFSRHGLIIRFC